MNIYGIIFKDNFFLSLITMLCTYFKIFNTSESYLSSKKVVYVIKRWL